MIQLHRKYNKIFLTLKPFRRERERDLIFQVNKIGKMRVVDLYSLKIYSIKIDQIRTGCWLPMVFVRLILGFSSMHAW